MNWFSNWIKTKARGLQSRNITNNEAQLILCDNCNTAIFLKDAEETLYVCHKCTYHLRASAFIRLRSIFQDYKLLHSDHMYKSAIDPLQFQDKKKYTVRLKMAEDATNLTEAAVIACGTLNDEIQCVAFVLDFGFIGGSMGVEVGTRFLYAVEYAIQQKLPLIVSTSSGGARMQEGILSLMQMARVIVAVNKLKAARLPYIVILSDPTTGGVLASIGMLGDIHIAEPNTTIGFAGKRVIAHTIKEKLPDNFQTTQYAYDTGMIDMVVARSQINATLIKIICSLGYIPPRCTQTPILTTG